MDFEHLRARMVTEQLRARGISDERVLAAMLRIPRHRFVPCEEQDQAYADCPVPIGYGQTVSQPYIVALMTEFLSVSKGDSILEIGTGSGYQTAVLAELAGEVRSVEILTDLTDRARVLLGELGYANISFRTGDGREGWLEGAPFDKIIVTAAPDRIPGKLSNQLREGGRIVSPVGIGAQILTVGEKRHGVLETFDSIPVRFVPLIGPQE